MFFVQAIVTVTIIGALKRWGVISIHPEKIQNATARHVFLSTVKLGESVTELGENVVEKVKRLISRPAVH